jgi:hypothetical protein
VLLFEPLIAADGLALPEGQISDLVLQPLDLLVAALLDLLQPVRFCYELRMQLVVLVGEAAALLFDNVQLCAASRGQCQWVQGVMLLLPRTTG